jgi:hypothetical protein
MHTWDFFLLWPNLGHQMDGEGWPLELGLLQVAAAGVVPAAGVVLTATAAASLLTVNSCIKVRLDLQADKSPVVVKGPFFPRVVNPRYRIRGTNV